MTLPRARALIEAEPAMNLLDQARQIVALGKQAEGETGMTREEADALIPPRKITLEVDVGDGATMCITDPLAYKGGGPEWISRYGNIELHRYQIASMIDSYDYLLSDLITMTEAVRRLRIMRSARRAGFKQELVHALQESQP